MVQPVPTKALLQPVKVATMCTACVEYGRPPLLIPPILLVQSLSSKQTAPTDKVAKVRRHQKASLVAS